MSKLLEPWTLLVVHSLLGLFMCGLIWFVQIVHYPLFEAVGREHFSRYEQLHVQRVGWIVGPAMLAEAVSAVALLLAWPPSPVRTLLWVNLVLLALIWISTAVWQVPQHETLRSGYQTEAARFLVASNWVRTVCWTLRAVILAGLLTVRPPAQ
ncbi:MAG: hypothetical protein J0L64_07040 [Acidobacteria bacterium]|nr:hypothetical protein [Acidobacteriota bacterium]